MIIEHALISLQAIGVEINREHWFKDEVDADKAGSVRTAQAIIKYVMGIAVGEQDRKHTWMAGAGMLMAQGATECARAIHAHAIQALPNKQSVWLRAADFEWKRETREALVLFLQNTVQNCPKREVLWLVGAKSKWINGDVLGARSILAQAFQSIPNS